ncbi:hypothetical protein H9V85_005005 [Salmonella enterica subsp. enterica serovar Louisiana]|uniref:Reverse transcriptase N-terminal domain-containing protein n=2 Tax=Salmonella enterica TaxID=28901 RepID=A0A763SVI1_SALER|nr:hypothetical protein [Salmonella enterica]EBG0215882.1 hypothetical protein [Salmonella enterica subsp. enterica serovar Louisiana]EBR9812281.1 hypothetical protein [Salmonella enterica subsp. enterica serovar Teshie]EBS5460914.1 hypothetical protein [Salmonella enterica subsp. enterica serovar Enteritidis]EBS5544137.1 hypothetical protein [Salmonella enterica subsp. enterica serovar Plymouth]ECA1253020.1 hypothetical protein [Salmonella enterica subsp. enterica serovar Chailey]ECB1045794.
MRTNNGCAGYLQVDWRQVEDDVSRLQMRIAKATKAQRRNKV